MHPGELRDLLATLREFGVTEYSCGDVSVRLAPVLVKSPEQAPIAAVTVPEKPSDIDSWQGIAALIPPPDGVKLGV